jgi:hypothetical protein
MSIINNQTQQPISNPRLAHRLVTFLDHTATPRSLSISEFCAQHHYDGNPLTTTPSALRLVNRIGLPDQPSDTTNTSPLPDPSNISPIPDLYAFATQLASALYDDPSAPSQLDLTPAILACLAPAGRRPGLTSASSPLALATRLAHEFAHLRNAASRTQDTSPTSPAYHNDHFRREAEDIYLTHTTTRGSGYGQSRPTPQFRQIVDALLTQNSLPII